MASARKLALISLLVIIACHEPTEPSRPGEGRTESDVTAYPGVARGPTPGFYSDGETILYGSSARGANQASLFRIDELTGEAMLIGPSGLAVGSERISALDFDPFSGRLYGIKGGACHGALLITIDPATGAGTVVGALKGQGHDFSPGPQCPGGSAALAFALDGTMYVGGWYGGSRQGKIMRVDRKTGEILELHPTPYGFGDWKGRRAHMSGSAVDAHGTLWVSRGASALPGQINTVDPTTGDFTSTLYLSDPDGNPEEDVTISDLAFAPDGTLYASLPWENMLAIVDTSTGVLTRIGGYGQLVDRISGLTAAPAILQNLLGRYWFREAAAGQAPAAVLDDTPAPLDLAVHYDRSMAWTESDGHRGLRFERARWGRGRGGVTSDAAGTKYEEALDGATQATFVTVAAWAKMPIVQPLAGFRGRVRPRGRFARFFPPLPVPVATFGTLGKGRPAVTLRTTRQRRVLIFWDRDLGDDGRRAFHVVYDADDPVAERRIRLYVNGVDQGPGRVLLGRLPVPGEGLDFAVDELELQVMARTPLSRFGAARATVFYHAIYRAALTAPEIAGNAAALLGDDDDLRPS